MTKSELKTGMFGIADDLDDDIFVVVGDKLVYKNGHYDHLADVSEDLVFMDGCKVIEIHMANCFEEVEDGNSEVIWTRPVDSDKRSITLTEENFYDIVAKVNAEIMKTGKEVGTKDDIITLTGMRNLTFASMIAGELFGN
jgi:hypothetical protein